MCEPFGDLRRSDPIGRRSSHVLRKPRIDSVAQGGIFKFRLGQAS